MIPALATDAGPIGGERMSEIKRPETFSGCEPGDDIFVESLPNQPRRVYRRHGNETTDISGVTDAVEPIEGGFRVGGKQTKAHHFVNTRWSAEVEADRESSPEYLRGVVR